MEGWSLRQSEGRWRQAIGQGQPLGRQRYRLHLPAHLPLHNAASPQARCSPCDVQLLGPPALIASPAPLQKTVGWQSQRRRHFRADPQHVDAHQRKEYLATIHWTWRQNRWPRDFGPPMRQWPRRAPQGMPSVPGQVQAPPWTPFQPQPQDRVAQVCPFGPLRREERCRVRPEIPLQVATQ